MTTEDSAEELRDRLVVGFGSTLVFAPLNAWLCWRIQAKTSKGRGNATN